MMEEKVRQCLQGFHQKQNEQVVLYKTHSAWHFIQLVSGYSLVKLWDHYAEHDLIQFRSSD